MRFYLSLIALQYTLIRDLNLERPHLSHEPMTFLGSTLYSYDCHYAADLRIAKCDRNRRRDGAPAQSIARCPRRQARHLCLMQHLDVQIGQPFAMSALN